MTLLGAYLEASGMWLLLSARGLTYAATIVATVGVILGRAA